MVISLGLLALFGLGRLALRNAQTLEDETRSAMLAEDIFASIRTVSETLCASNNPGVWAEFWCAFRDGQTPLPLQLSTATSFQNRNNSDVWGNGSICTNDLWSRPGIHGTTNSMPEWRARYRLVIDDPTGGTNLFKVQLYITPGLAGPFDESRPILGLFAEHGTLP